MLSIWGMASAENRFALFRAMLSIWGMASAENRFALFRAMP
jgi:hypothetical protein